MSFQAMGLHAALLRGVEDLGFTEPTPIQRDAIPSAMQGRDLLACSMTGSGKTAAFLLPLLHHLKENPKSGTRALVLTPTRELAAQIDEHLRLIAGYAAISSATIFGGVPMGPQERAFRKGASVLVATPGRLLDHLRHPYARLGGVEYLVLDEADRMLDMGFLPDIRRILKEIPVKRQTFLFSATLPPSIVTLANEMLNDPVSLNIERKVNSAPGITHTAYSVPQTMKSPLLFHLLQLDAMKSVVVFTRTKHRANRLADYLEKRGISVARIHGNRSQSQRTLALAGFKKKEFRVLVATDIAARGIDVEALSHVVNFDVPNMPEDYVHRVGRTARVDAKGDAVTFASPEEEGNLRAIEKALGKRLPRLTAPEMTGQDALAQSPETPLAERVAEIRRTRGSQRNASHEKAERINRPNPVHSPARKSQDRPAKVGEQDQKRESRHRGRERAAIQGNGPVEFVRQAAPSEPASLVTEKNGATKRIRSKSTALRQHTS